MKTETGKLKPYNLAEKRACCIALLVALVTICAGATLDVEKIKTASQKQLKAQEYKIKAVYLYNFLLFTEWPKQNTDEKNKDKTITIGILGNDPFYDRFAEVEDRTIKSKKKILRIKRLGKYNNKIKLWQCDLLFISSSEIKNLKKILNQIENLPILTVADTENFLQAGGMINFVKSKNKVRWEINRTPVKKANLRLNSQLLRNAVNIIEKPNNKNTENNK